MKISVKVKLFGGFGIILLLLCVVAITGYTNILSLNNANDMVMQDRPPKVKMLKDIAINFSQQAMQLRNYLLWTDDKYLGTVDSLTNTNHTSISKLSAILDDPDEQSAAKDITTLNQNYISVRTKILDLQKNGKHDEALNEMQNTLFPVYNQLIGKVNDATAFQESAMDKDSKDIDAKAANVIRNLIIISALAVVIGVLLSWYIGVMITRPIIKLSNAARAIAEGDLTQQDVKVINRDEFMDLADAFNTMKSNLLALISGIHASATHVAAAAEELTASTEEVSKSAEGVTDRIQHLTQYAVRTADSSHESSRAMQETAIGVQHIAESVQVVADKSNETLTAANKGNKAIEAAVSQMNTIKTNVDQSLGLAENLNKQSEEIGEITNAIMAITAQTNLLALNAAIEAARAGEHGRGFSVVASEVRKLAEQSQGSATKISGLIASIQQDTQSVTASMRNSANEVQSGVTIMDQVGSTFHSIRTSAQTVFDQVEGISSTAEEMSASTQEVTAAVDQIAGMSNDTSKGANEINGATQEQLSRLEEITSVAGSMSKMAMELQDMIQRFKV